MPARARAALKVSKFALAILLILIATSAKSANTDVETTLEVQSWCQPFKTVEIQSDHSIAIPTDFNTGSCWGAFAAIQDLSGLVDAPRAHTPILLFCPPETGSRLQYIKIFLRYVDQHPEQGHLGFAGTARLALAEAFPCPKE